MSKERREIKNIVYNTLWWTFFVISVINLIMTIPTWVGWKWGYFSIDAIPPLMILLFLYFINQNRRISYLENKIRSIYGEY